MENIEDVCCPTDFELLQAGLDLLSQSLGHIMEMKCSEGHALAHFIHSSLEYGETLLDLQDDPFPVDEEQT